MRGKPIGLPDSRVAAAFGGGDVVRGIRDVGLLTFIAFHTPHGCNDAIENAKVMVQKEGWTSASVVRSKFRADTHLHEINAGAPRPQCRPYNKNVRRMARERKSQRSEDGRPQVRHVQGQAEQIHLCDYSNRIGQQEGTQDEIGLVIRGLSEKAGGRSFLSQSGESQGTRAVTVRKKERGKGL